jgi:hypothetical protein
MTNDFGIPLPMKAEVAFLRFSSLVDSMPNLRSVTGTIQIPAPSLKWLGSLHALLENAGYTREAVLLRVETDKLTRTQGSMGSNEIAAILYRALADAELRSPPALHGSFIAAGNEFHAFAALSKVLGAAQSDILIIDPYMDEVTLTDFAPLSAVGVPLRLLAADGKAKSTLKPAVDRWRKEYGTDRPLAARMSTASALHDRLILIDKSKAWLLTQSLKDFAKKSHGSIALADQESSNMKVTAYEDIWLQSIDF